MMRTATIYPDGRIQYHGYERMTSTVRGLTKTHVVIHHPGGCYWDNGGKHYVAARYEVVEYLTIMPANEPDTFIVTFPPIGRFFAQFHPGKEQAVRVALAKARQLTTDGRHDNPTRTG